MGGRSVVTSVDGRDLVRSLDCVVVVNSAEDSCQQQTSSIHITLS